MSKLTKNQIKEIENIIEDKFKNDSAGDEIKALGGVKVIDKIVIEIKRIEKGYYLQSVTVGKY